MDDCISRKMAIDAVDKRFDSIPMEQTTEILMLRKDLRELPSAQPEVLDCGSGELVKDSQRLVEASSNDMISRQQAIEAIDAVFPVDPMKSEYAQGIACGAALAKTYVEQLPSAQPERKKGKWIWWYEEAVTEHATEYTPHCKCSECGRECAPSVATYSNFCRNCGADMRGESDETD